ncbi:hypothetical protein CsatA_010386 [Cannabis sativa]
MKKKMMGRISTHTAMAMCCSLLSSAFPLFIPFTFLVLLLAISNPLGGIITVKYQPSDRRGEEKFTGKRYALVNLKSCEVREGNLFLGLGFRSWFLHDVALYHLKKDGMNALGSIEVIDMCDSAVGLSLQLNGSIIPSERPNHMMLEVWNPLGNNQGDHCFQFPLCCSWCVIVIC